MKHLLILLFLIIGFNLQGSEPPSTIVIFGATGDLTARKLLPALFNLAHEDLLPPQSVIIGFARGEHTDDTFRQKMKEAIEQFSRVKDPAFWNHFEKQIFYHRSDFENDEGYKNLKLEGRRLFYLATPPSHFSTILKKLHEHHLIDEGARVVIEKPFGTDLESAMSLKNDLSLYLDPSQVYLMDHYLGKEGVQNILKLRFESGFLEPMWNKDYIDHIQITLGEDLGICNRANLWEETGTLRDVFQNHLMQILAFLAMEKPDSFTSRHQQKIAVLNALRPFPLADLEAHVIRGQYGPGEIKGKPVAGYFEETGVSSSSTAETFVAAKIFIDNPRWSGVPFYLRSGKRLAKQTTEVVVAFKNNSTLHIRIQPSPTLYLKTPTEHITYDTQNSPSEAYENLLYDCIQGDPSLFVHSEEQLAAWRLFTPVLHHWKLSPSNPHPYEAGSWGPPIADEMLNENGHYWILDDSLPFGK